MQTTTSFLVLSLFLLSTQYHYSATCFVPVHPRRLQELQFANHYTSLLQLRLHIQEEQQVETKNVINDSLAATTVAPDDFCMLEDIEVGCIDPLLDKDVPKDMSPETLSLTLSYIQFAKTYPNINNIGIATMKNILADLLAQVAFSHIPVLDVDWNRTLAFGLFGAMYSGAFQYWFQVNIFKKLFDVDSFTSKSWQDKLKDIEGLKSLAAQTAVDLTVSTLVYLPTFYIFKACVFSGSNTIDPSIWLFTGLDNYINNFSKDELDLVRVWAPADLVCFSVALYLRLPTRHVISFLWTSYLSFARGGH